MPHGWRLPAQPLLQSGLFADVAEMLFIYTFEPTLGVCMNGWERVLVCNLNAKMMAMCEQPKSVALA